MQYFVTSGENSSFMEIMGQSQIVRYEIACVKNKVTMIFIFLVIETIFHNFIVHDVRQKLAFILSLSIYTYGITDI